MKRFINMYLRISATENTEFHGVKNIVSVNNSMVCFFLFLLFAGLAQAKAQEEEIFRHPLGPQTVDAFITTCSLIAEHPIVRGNFEQEKILGRLNRSLVSSGNFIITADQGMVWDTVRPFPSTLALGRDYLVQSRPGGQKTVLSAQGNETFLRMAEVLSTVFSGSAQGLLVNFDVYFSGSSAGWEMGLTPREKAVNSIAEKITMKGDTVIRSIHIFEQNGDSTKYTLKGHSFPAVLDVHEKAFFSVP